MNAGGCRILDSAQLPGGWALLRLECPAARVAAPGQALQLEVEGRTLQAPIARIQPVAGWLALLLPPPVAAALGPIKPHQPCARAELIGEPFELPAEGAVLVGEEAGIGPILLLAEQAPAPLLVLLGSREPPPFRPRPSRMLIPGLPAASIAAAPSLEDLGIPSRIANPAGLPGCFEGSVIELLAHWLKVRDLAAASIIAAGPFGLEQQLRQAAGVTPQQLRLMA